MIGNGLPVPMAKAVASAMKFFLETNQVIKSYRLNGYMVKTKSKSSNGQNQGKKHKA